LHSQVLIARGSAKPDDVMKKIEEHAAKILADRLSKTQITKADLPDVKRQIVEQVKADYQLVAPGTGKPWRIKLGAAAKSLENEPLQLRIKFNTAQKSLTGSYLGLWQVGDPPNTKSVWRSEPMSLAPDTFHEIDIPPGLIDTNGVLTVIFANPNSSALLFPIEDSMEVLYRDGGFGMNFVRGLAIIFCWMALLAAIGLASASFLGFSVAALWSLTVLVVALSSGTLANVVSEGTIDASSEGDRSSLVVLDKVIVPVFRVALNVINFARDYSPIDSLSTGRTIT